MPDVTIYGPAMSTYVRTARMACAEKGITHALEEVDFGSIEYRRLHPFNKVPAMRHGDFVLYETEAICRYVDRVFPGPALQPKDIKAQARMDQWLSAIGDYVYAVMIEELCWERLIIPMGGGQPDEAKIKAALPKVKEQLAIFEAALKNSEFLAGAEPSLADFMLFPILVYVKATPEGQALLQKAPKVRAWLDRIGARPSAAATDPTRG
ncbi:MAG TPA: glutathione S-transferase family protein [Alphaproteobacteria bacterium]